MDAEDAATSAAVSGVHTTINLRGIAWQRNAYNNKLIPDDATDDEGNGSAAAMAADARVQLVHIWVRGNGTGLAVVDSHADVAGERLDLGGGIQYVLAYRRGENPARFVTNLSADDVRSIEDRSGGEEPKPAEGKGDDDDKGGGDKGGRADPACMLTLTATDDDHCPGRGQRHQPDRRDSLHHQRLLCDERHHRLGHSGHWEAFSLQCVMDQRDPLGARRGGRGVGLRLHRNIQSHGL